MHLIGTQLALPLLWPDWFTLGETGFSLAGSCFDWQLWHWLQWWRGGTSHRGWYYRKRGRQRLHTHTHINISTDILLLPPFVLCKVVVAPPLMPPCSPGEAKPAVPSEAHPILFHPPHPSSALISSYLMHLSPHLSSPPHCHTTRIRNIKGILLISGLWPSSEVLPLSSDSPINPFAFLLLSLFPTDSSDVMLAVLSEILHRNQAGCFSCQSEVISMAILLPASLFGQEHSVRSRISSYFLSVWL